MKDPYFSPPVKILSFFIFFVCFFINSSCGLFTADWSKVSSSGFYPVHTLALQSDGSLWGWGSNTSSQLGNVISMEVTSPVKLDDFKWKDIATGSSYSLAIRSDDTLWAWGENLFGQLGNGETSLISAYKPQQIGTSKWKMVDAYSYHSLGIQIDGSLWSWGQLYTGQYPDPNISSPTLISTAEWIYVSAGQTYALAIQSDGSLWGWGNGGLLGNGTTQAEPSPVQIGTAKWKKVSAGPREVYGIQEDGTLWAWGWNFFGTLGDGTTIDRATPVQISSDSWTNISAGEEFCLGITADGTLWGWGNNGNGELGLGTTGPGILYQTTPLQISTTTWNNIEAAGTTSFGIQEDGTLWTWGWTPTLIW